MAANTLAGYLMSHDDRRFNYRELALSTLEEALEHPFPNADQEQHASAVYHIPAAIKLFETVGDKICQWCEESIQASRQDLRQSGPLWTGQSGYCRGRWELWQRKFHEISGVAQLPKEYQDGTRKTVETMSEISQKYTYTF